jgi:hypothetical protein
MTRWLPTRSAKRLGNVDNSFRTSGSSSLGSTSGASSGRDGSPSVGAGSRRCGAARLATRLLSARFCELTCFALGRPAIRPRIGAVRAAPPFRAASGVGFSPADTVTDPLIDSRTQGPPGCGWGPLWWGCVRRCPTLPHPGGCSTIGAGGLSFRVRDGSGRFPSAMAAVTRVELFGCVPVLRELHSGCVLW